MGNLASTQLSTQSDPALVQRQILADREKQLASITNPQQQLAARLGGLLGGGLVNVAQDRGFFEVNDPLLTKVTQIQGIYNQVASRVDPTADPARFYSELQSAYSNAGLGREALAAAQEAQKAKGSALDLQLKETAALEKNPELIAGKIEAALKAGNEPEAMRLANLSTRLQEDRELTLEGKRVNILKDKAYIAYQNKLASDEKFTFKPVDPMNPLAGDWRIDQRGNREYVPFPDDVAAKISGTPKAKDGKDKPSQADADARILQMRSGTTTAPASTATAAPTPTAPNATPTDMSAPNMAAYNQRTGVYKLNDDPIIKMISEYAGQNRTLLETNPDFAKSITDAYANRREELSRTMGSGIRFQ